MNRSLHLLATAALGLAAFVAACTSSSSTTTPEGSPTSGTADAGTGKGEGTNADGDDEPDVEEETKDAGSSTSKDGGTGGKDGGTSTPKAFTKSEVQTLVNSRCAPCHIDYTSGGMSLKSDFTVATVDVASTEAPALKRIKPGKKEESYLFHKLRGTHLTVGGSGDRMPKSGPPYLPDSDIDRIGAYIDGL